MLRKNNTLTTLDVHGCGNRKGRCGQEVLEGYGCKVIKASDGTEYVARVVAPTSEEDEGLVTDQRLLDAIQTFVAFNRIDPTREQAVRGIMTSNKISQDDTKKEQQVTNNVTKFLAELSSLPAHEKLSDEEKRKWKDCEWERLYVELERVRAARRASRCGDKAVQTPAPLAARVGREAASDTAGQILCQRRERPTRHPGWPALRGGEPRSFRTNLREGEVAG